MGYELGNIIVIEDLAGNVAKQYGNLVVVTPFRGNNADMELSMLIDYLGYLKNVPDVRRIEKRNWREVARSLKFTVTSRILEPKRQD